MHRKALLRDERDRVPEIHPANERGPKLRSSVWKWIVAALAVVAVGAFAIGCGGDDDGDGDETVSADEYVSSVCTAITDMVDVLQGGQAELQNALTSDPEEGKDLLVGFLNDSADTLESTRDELEAAGVPDVEGGEQIAETIPAAFGDLQSSIEDAAAQAEEVSTDSPTEFIEQIEAVGKTVQDAGGQVGESLNELASSDELEAAAEEADACQQLAG